MSSQKAVKQGPPNEILEEKAVQPEKKSEKSEEDYFVPTFGSQVQNPSVKNADGKVEPFSLNGNREGLKRNFTNMQEQKGY